jgi:hypothetical protein
MEAAVQTAKALLASVDLVHFLRHCCCWYSPSATAYSIGLEVLRWQERIGPSGVLFASYRASRASMPFIFAGVAASYEQRPALHGINLLSTLTLAASFYFLPPTITAEANSTKKAASFSVPIEIDGRGELKELPLRMGKELPLRME